MTSTQTQDPLNSLTGDHTYFEDFVVEDVIRHHRGKTITEVDGVQICHQVMNTADGHFNDHAMAGSIFGKAIVFGGITASIVVGLASQDTSENAIAELGIDALEFPHRVVHGDTVYAYTRVVATELRDDTAGVVTFEHWGLNQDDQVVCRMVRRVLIPRRGGEVTS